MGLWQVLAHSSVRQMSIEMIKIKRGMTLPLAGTPAAAIDTSSNCRAVALIGPDYHGMKPTMAVQVGDSVKRGDLLFTDKKCEGVRHTAPAGGRVTAINRGAKRAFQSLVIDIEDDEAAAFQRHTADQAKALSGEAIREQLLLSIYVRRLTPIFLRAATSVSLAMISQAHILLVWQEHTCISLWEPRSRASPGPLVIKM